MSSRMLAVRIATARQPRPSTTVGTQASGRHSGLLLNTIRTTRRMTQPELATKTRLSRHCIVNHPARPEPTVRRDGGKARACFRKCSWGRSRKMTIIPRDSDIIGATAFLTLVLVIGLVRVLG